MGYHHPRASLPLRKRRVHVVWAKGATSKFIEVMRNAKQIDFTRHMDQIITVLHSADSGHRQAMNVLHAAL